MRKEHFNVNAENRTDAFAKKEMSENVKVGREIREILKKSIENDGWPECPRDLENIEDFFEAAYAGVGERWAQHVEKYLSLKRGEWLKKIPDIEENKEVRNILSDPGELEISLKIRQFGALEDLRDIAPEIWMSLLSISSERQLAAAALSRRWAGEIKEEDLSETGLSKDELELYLDLVGSLGKHIDQAYMKQTELAAAPTGKDAGMARDALGSDRTYEIDFEESHDLELKPYAEVFSFEIKKIVNHLERLSLKIKKMLSEGRLPPSYRDFPVFLESLAKVYESKDVIDVDLLHKKWEKIDSMAKNLLVDGCPITVSPQGTATVAGDANKVDMEMRFGIKTAKNKNIEEELSGVREMAERINEEYGDAVADKRISRVSLDFQPFSFGPNLYWKTRGEEGKNLTVVHENSTTEVAAERDIPLLKKAFGFDIDKEVYAKASIVETFIHEIGHSILPRDDKKVKDRVGISHKSGLLEELKAEAAVMLLLRKAMKKNIFPKKDLDIQFLVKVGTIFNYLVNKSREEGSTGEDYFFAGAVMAGRLINEEVIIRKEDRYEIFDAGRGMEVLAGLSEEIIEFYADPRTTVAAVGEKVDEMKKVYDEKSGSGNEKLIELIKFLKK